MCGIVGYVGRRPGQPIIPPEWEPVLPLLRASPRLRDAASVLLTNVIDAGEYGPYDEYDSKLNPDLPRDEDGSPWYPDVWELKEALAEANGERTEQA